ncbi:glycosyltransferase [Pseudochelatococcus sp. B33]
MAVTLHTTILDMQPIDPPVGGGRLRLLGLYHGLGAPAAGQDAATSGASGDGRADASVRHAAHYVGTYDWRGPGLRRQQLTPVLFEEIVPLTEAHFAASDRLAEELGGKNVIDTAFHTMAHLSPDFVEAARKAAERADVVVFSHPWIYPLVRDVLRPDRQLIVYDAHNVEGVLRTELLDDGAGGSAVARGVVEVENAVCTAADLVLACSHEDASAFSSIYGVPFDRIRVIPNGTFTRKIKPPSVEEKHQARQQLDVEGRPVAFFLGSNYGPNVEAARFITDALAPALPTVLFVVGGGVGEGLEQVTPPANVRITGRLSDEELLLWLRASDIAVNPMFGGSGTNIKMLDFMAAGLPIVSTAVGARGIATSERAFLVAQADNFAETVRGLLANEDERQQLAHGVRTQADRFYSWERISDYLGILLARWAQVRNGSGEAPFFSVIVPTYERHALLTRLTDFIAAQTWRDFEVIVVDQSAQPWPDRDRDFGFDLHYIHTDRKGAVTARNTGAGLARGKVIAFTDDDCEPSEGWLAAAHKAFTTSDIVGLEGLIRSDRVGDPDWRPVTNDGFEGIGFMTANLFVRSDVFQQLDGFDIALEKPHFREDTDLGWRMQDLGEIPFSRDAWVYHPPHSREIERESIGVRSTFFLNDAILLRKHPERYAELLLREVQWLHNPHFWDQFLKGIELHGVELPHQIREIMRENAGIHYTGPLNSGANTLAHADTPAAHPPARTGESAHPAQQQPPTLRDTLRRSVSWTVRPVWRRVWARIEGRVRPIDQRLDATREALQELQHTTDARLSKIEAGIEALDKRLAKLLDGAEFDASRGGERQPGTDEVVRAALLVLRYRAELEALRMPRKVEEQSRRQARSPA